MKRTLRCKAFVCLLLALCLALPLAACSKPEPVMADKDHVFSAKYLELPENARSAYDIVADENYAYMVSTDWNNKRGVSINYLVTIDLATQEIATKELKTDFAVNSEFADDPNIVIDSSFRSMQLAGDGTFWALFECYAYPMEWDEEKYADWDYDSLFYMVQFDARGEQLQAVDVLAQLGDRSADEYLWLNDFCLVGEHMYISADNKFFVLDKAGKHVGTVVAFEEGWVSNMLTWGDKLLFTGTDYTSENYEAVAYTVDSPKAEPQKLEIPGEFNLDSYQIYPGDASFDLYGMTQSGLYGISLTTGERTLLCDWLASDIDGSNMYTAVPLSNEKVIATGYDSVLGERVVTIMTKIPPEQVADKVALTIGCYYLDYNIREQVLKFNRLNETYRITVKSYEEEYGWEEAQTKMNADMIAGQVCDIMIFNDPQNLAAYNSKGIFLDLYTLMDKEGSPLTRDMFVPSVLEAMDTDGKLYQLTPSFYLSTCMAEKKYVGDVTTLTYDDAMAALEKCEEGSGLMAGMTREYFLQTAISLDYASYVDPVTGQCRFDSEGFRKLLQLAEMFPTEEEMNEYYENLGSYDKMAVAADTVIGMPAPMPGYGGNMDAPYYLLDRLMLSEMSEYRYSRYNFGKDADIVLCGYPTDSGAGHQLQGFNMMGIYAKSPAKDGAWEFFSYVLSPENQEELYEFPVTQAAFDKKIENAKKPPFYIDEEGNEVEYEDYYYIDGEEIIMEPLSQKEIDMILAAIYGAENFIVNDAKLNEIINEEAGAYYAGQKSLDEVVGIIQNRAQTYISENR